MFTDRKKEDRCCRLALPGWLDLLFLRWGDQAYLRKKSAAAARIMASGRSMAFCLSCGQLVTVEGSQTCLVRCDRGKIWVTASGDDRDRVLRTGQSATIVFGGKLVISGWADGASGSVRFV